MATCPNCGAKSREDPDAFVVETAFVAKPPLGTFSLAGNQMKVSALECLRLRCQWCGWSILGALDGGSFVGDPRTQRFPTPAPPED